MKLRPLPIKHQASSHKIWKGMFDLVLAPGENLDQIIDWEDKDEEQRSSMIYYAVVQCG